MITQVLPNIIPPTTTNDGLATLLDTSPAVVPSVVTENQVCVCKCNYRERVFSEVGAITDWNKNDKTTLLFKKAISADTITIKLIDGDTEYTITDDTYGTYYAPGSLTSQPLYVGFVADWNKIYNALGPGLYTFEITTVIIGVTTTIDSIEYFLQPYSDRAADGTVRIETYNTGTILSSLFDYTDLLSGGWYQSFRIRGKLLPKVPKLVTDNYYDQDYNLRQIQDKITDEYTLDLSLVPIEIADKLIYDNLLANRILVSDYNIYNEDVKRQVELYPIEIDKKVYTFNIWARFTIKFTTVIDNIIKNNF